MSQLWGALCHPEGSGLYPAKRHPLRDNEIASDLAQTAVALQGTAVSPSLVHRVASRGPGTFEADDTVSGRAGPAVAEQQRCVSEAATHYGASWPIVHNAFVEHVRVPLAAPCLP